MICDIFKTEGVFICNAVFEYKLPYCINLKLNYLSIVEFRWEFLFKKIITTVVNFGTSFKPRPRQIDFYYNFWKNKKLIIEITFEIN